jgi:hypothetical protein
MKRIPRSLVVATIVVAAGLLGAGQTQRPPKGGGVRMPAPAFLTDVRDHPFDLIMGRPTRDAVTLSVLVYRDLRASVYYGESADALTFQTPVRGFTRGEPAELKLNGLKANTRYFFELRPEAGSERALPGASGSFTTARPPGSAFTFTVQSDSHLDFGTDPAVYTKSLANVVAARADFHFDLGDTFMTDKRDDFHTALPQYLAQRYYLGLAGLHAPVFLVLGNHDGEETKRGGTGPDSMAVWSNGMRKKYFPNPVPDDFYTGNRRPHPQAGLLQDYYAFEWGDALFVVLDPYWFNAPRGRTADNWSRTLGRAQYDWLVQTLETSRAKFKFVFLHNLVGGETPEGRGGAEASRFFEWGGSELDGRDTFAAHRPGWPAPIHDVLVRNGVSVVFHGHDHFYATQERDGIVYQLVPQPGHVRADDTRSAAEYGYKGGVIQGPSGIMRVSVSSTEANVEYVRAYPANVERGERKTGAVTHRYTVTPPAAPTASSSAAGSKIFQP